MALHDSWLPSQGNVRPDGPEKVISSPSGPCTTDTPGVSVSRSSNLRPRIGVVPIVADHQKINETRIAALELTVQRLSVIEDRQNNVISTLRENARKLDQIADQLAKLKTP